MLQPDRKGIGFPIDSQAKILKICSFWVPFFRSGGNHSSLHHRFFLDASCDSFGWPCLGLVFESELG